MSQIAIDLANKIRERIMREYVQAADLVIDASNSPKDSAHNTLILSMHIVPTLMALVSAPLLMHIRGIEDETPDSMHPIFIGIVVGLIVEQGNHDSLDDIITRAMNMCKRLHVPLTMAGS